jgi:hypothetical protein
MVRIALSLSAAFVFLLAMNQSIGSQEPAKADPRIAELAKVEQVAIAAHRILFDAELAAVHRDCRKSDGPCNWCHCGNCDQIAESRAECNTKLAEVRLKRIKAGKMDCSCDNCSGLCPDGCECPLKNWPEGKPIPASMKHGTKPVKKIIGYRSVQTCGQGGCRIEQVPVYEGEQQMGSGGCCGGNCGGRRR